MRGLFPAMLILGAIVGCATAVRRGWSKSWQLVLAALGSAAALGEAIRQAIPDAITQPSPSAPAATRMLSATAAAPATVVHDALPPVAVNADVGASSSAPTTTSTRSHWVSGAVGLLALAITTVLWFWFERDAMPPVSTPSATATEVAPVATPRNTPRDEPAVADAMVLDDFGDARWDAAYNIERWQPTKTFDRTTVMQMHGALRVATNGQNEGVYTELPARAQGRKLRRVSAGLRLIGPVVANHATGGFVLTRSDRADWWLACYAYGSKDTAQFTPTCTDPSGVYRTGTARTGEAFFGMSAALDHARGVFVLRADDEALGELPLPPVGEGVAWYLTLTAWSGDQTPVMADIDAVRVE